MNIFVSDQSFERGRNNSEMGITLQNIICSMVIPRPTSLTSQSFIQMQYCMTNYVNSFEIGRYNIVKLALYPTKYYMINYILYDKLHEYFVSYCNIVLKYEVQTVTTKYWVEGVA